MDAWIRNIMKSVAFASGSSSSRRRDEPEILLCKRQSSTSSSASTVVSASRHSVSPLVSIESSSASYQIQQNNQQRVGSNITNNNTRNSNSEHRIAHWDKKREKCGNCALIYLKTLSRHEGFCSVDCKSNARYLAKVNRTIRAMKDAVEQRQQYEKDEAEKAAATSSSTQEEAEPVAVVAQVQAPVQEPICEDENEDEEDERVPQSAAPHTFSEFGLESRILDASNVEWAFSALY